MEDKQLNPDQSYALIQQMISQTRRKVERNAGVPFLVGGYMTVAISVIVWFAVSRTDNPYWHLLWLTLSAASIVSWFVYRTKGRQKEVSTYVDRIVGQTWMTLGAVATVQSILAMFFFPMPILYIIVLLIGLGTAITGIVIRFRLVTIAGLVSALVLAPVLLFVKGIDACLVFAAVFVVMMVIPGHILNYRSNHPEKQ